MDTFFKMTWFLRAVFYMFFFRSLEFPSYIGKPTALLGVKNITIKKKVRIFPGVRLEAHNGGSILIEQNVSIAQNVHLTCSAINLVISHGTIILANTYITNIDHRYDIIDTPIFDQPISISPTFIGANCFIGMGVAIQAGTILGKQCIVGANAVVRGIFPDYSVIVGVPAKIVKRYNEKTKQWEKTNDKGEFLNEC
ncbi:MAG: acyltransferase [Candidatus Electrothrix sp. AS4_5]|nr:acyltransferase [Candidatus Electrothrix gigas]